MKPRIRDYVCIIACCITTPLITSSIGWGIHYAITKSNK